MKKKIRLNNNIIGKGKTIESKILKSILLRFLLHPFIGY